MLTLWSKVARMSPQVGAAPHSTAATSAGSRRAEGRMAAGGRGQRGAASAAGAGEGRSAPSLPLLRDPGGQSPPGATSQLHGGGRKEPDPGSEIANPVGGSGPATLEVPSSGTGIKQGHGTEASTGARKASGRAWSSRQWALGLPGSLENGF